MGLQARKNSKGDSCEPPRFDFEPRGCLRIGSLFFRRFAFAVMLTLTDLIEAFFTALGAIGGALHKFEPTSSSMACSAPSPLRPGRPFFKPMRTTRV